MTDEAPAEEVPQAAEEGEEVEEPEEIVDAGGTPVPSGQIPTLQYPEEYGEDYGEVQYGEGGRFVLYYGEGGEYPVPWVGSEYESSASAASVASTVSEAEETEEEKALRLLKESWIEQVKQKMSDRMLLRRRNVFLQKKLVEHFKKRRMDHVLKEDTKGLDLENKYLRRLYAFREFKQTQEEQIAELTENMVRFKSETNDLETVVNETLTKFMQRLKDFSSGLILAKTGKKLSEKVVDRLVRRQIKICEEMGIYRLKYIKIKYLIEEKEGQLRAMENFGEGLHMMDYEQMKIDNQNLNDKIEEKEEELSRLRVKTHGNIQNLAHVREKAYALAGDIELMEEKFYKVETKFNETRERVTYSKTKRDHLRGEYLHLKMQSGLLTNNRLLRDFEESIDEAEAVAEKLQKIKTAVGAYKQRELHSKSVIKPVSSYVDFIFPFEIDMGKQIASSSWHSHESEMLEKSGQNHQRDISSANALSQVSNGS